jgi:hypothetical protein
MTPRDRAFKVWFTSKVGPSFMTTDLIMKELNLEFMINGNMAKVKRTGTFTIANPPVDARLLEMVRLLLPC